MKKHIRSVTLAVFLTTAPQFAAAQQDGTISGDKSTDMVVDAVVMRPLGLAATLVGWCRADGGGVAVHDSQRQCGIVSAGANRQTGRVHVQATTWGFQRQWPLSAFKRHNYVQVNQFNT